MKLKITPSPDNTALVAFEQDHLDAGNVKQFRDAMAPCLTRHRAVLLDMQALTFIDSSGLGALLACLRSMHGRDGQLVLFGVRPPVLALLELVRMHRLFAIFATEQEARDDVLAGH